MGAEKPPIITRFRYNSAMNAATPVPSSPTPASELLRLADACVVCGLCVPHCPTYRKTGLEADSPRGRIQIMRGVLIGDLQPTPRVQQHLDLCLTCRACEAVCPNHVSYGELVNGMRARLRQSASSAPWERGLQWLVDNPRLAGWLRPVVAVVQHLPGAAKVSRRFGLPALPLAGFKHFYPAQGERRGAVGLFLGCVARLADAQTLHDSVRLLQAAGFDVHAPPAQACCSAMALHQGDAARASEQQAVNERIFAELPISAVLFSATGCGATLLDHPFGGMTTMDILDFLAQQHLRFRPLAEEVWLHEPCTQRNVVRSGKAMRTLLKAIPELRVHELPGNEQCCGAAGRYHLDQPAMAGQLRADKLLAIATARLVLSSNVGCAMWLRAARPDVEFIHPVSLLARQLEH